MTVKIDDKAYAAQQALEELGRPFELVTREELVAAPDNLPTVCPVCGGYTLMHEHSVSILLAVCDVLVMKALEKLGNYTLRAARARYQEAAETALPIHMIHTRWPAPDALVSKALRGAWDVVPYVLNSYGALYAVSADQVTATLDQYVHDLALTGREHDIKELAYRLNEYLGLPVFIKEKA